MTTHMLKTTFLLIGGLILSSCVSEEQSTQLAYLFDDKDLQQLDCPASDQSSPNNYTSIDMWVFTLINHTLESNQCPVAINTVISQASNEAYSEVVYNEMFEQIQSELTMGKLGLDLQQPSPVEFGLDWQWYNIVFEGMNTGVVFRSRLETNSYLVTAININDQQRSTFAKLLTNKLEALAQTAP